MNVLESDTRPSTAVLEQKVYDHLLHCARTELPDQVLQRFQVLFVQGGLYSEPSLRETVHELVRGKNVQQSFLPFFNRCCFILINRWQMNPLQRESIVQLVEILHQCRGPSVIVSHPSPAGRLRSLVLEYVRSDYFQRIRQLAEFLNPNDQDERRPLSALLHRYPYLYSHCLTNSEDGEEYQKMIVGTQRKATQQFQQDLSSYMTYALLKPEKSQSTIMIPSKNPTLLSHQDLCSSLKHYVTKVDSKGSYKDMAQRFWTLGQQIQSYGSFKDSLSEYIASSIPPKFGRCRFNDQFHDYLDSLYPENNSSAINDFLIVRTCNQVLNFMVIESKQRPNHSVFIDLLNNLGSTLTVGLLLKVVLLCNKVKPSLERRLSLLFQHYESQNRGSVNWLVRCLEKLNLAWSAHFSNQNLSYIHLL